MADGSFSITVGAADGTAYAGMNCVDPTGTSYLWAGSDVNATDPTLRTISLATGDGQGTFLYIQNYCNLLVTQSAFSITNHTPKCDGLGEITLINGDWLPTKCGETLVLLNNGMDWVEQGRFYGSSGMNPTNYPFGRLTPPFIPYAIDTNHLADSHLYWTPNGTGTDTNFFFGPTNVFFRLGSDFYLTNGAANGFNLRLGDASGYYALYGVNGSGAPTITSTRANQPVYITAGNATGGLYVTPNSLQPGTETISIGTASSTGAFTNAYVKGATHIVGTNDGLGNYTWTELKQADTNSPFVINQITAGTAGESRGYEWQTNGMALMTLGGGVGLGSSELIVKADDYNGYVDIYADRAYGDVGIGTSNSNWDFKGSTNGIERLHLIGVIDLTNVVSMLPGVPPAAGAAKAYHFSTTSLIDDADVLFEAANREKNRLKIYGSGVLELGETAGTNQLYFVGNVLYCNGKQVQLVP